MRGGWLLGWALAGVGAVNEVLKRVALTTRSVKEGLAARYDCGETLKRSRDGGNVNSNDCISAI